MEQIESVDDLKKALKVDDLRQMSSEKVLTLVQLIQTGQISSGVLSALLSTAPNTMASLAQAMDESVQNAAASNEKSSDNFYSSIAFTKRLLAQIAQDPNASEDARRDALDRLERYDNKLFEHDINNKRFNLEALKLNKETLGAIATGVTLVAVAVISPDARKAITKNAPKALSVAKQILPGA
ncbi:hypothetical protein [uncultured Corynebacterium sp.]|uniref:hypothetical protein n=1 Tax=uncultured Corynebacterium sp. TaxID=159447 RepID=UPI0025D52770|nr:hypothetical protein [uncultured Corynebacterium sp.]